MNVELYNKMTDDEKLQYICDLENYSGHLDYCNHIKNDIIAAQEKLYRTSKDLANEEYMKCDAFRIMMEYKKCMQKKYDVPSAPAYRCTVEEN